MNVLRTASNTPLNGHLNNIKRAIPNSLFRARIVVSSSSLGNTSFLTPGERLVAYSKFMEKSFETPVLQVAKGIFQMYQARNNSGLKIEKNGSFKHLEVFVPTEKGGWIIHYYARSNEFGLGLPDVQKILSSLKVIDLAR